jgi:hypothetical protein
MPLFKRKSIEFWVVSRLVPRQVSSRFRTIGVVIGSVAEGSWHDGCAWLFGISGREQTSAEMFRPRCNSTNPTQRYFGRLADVPD